MVHGTIHRFGRQGEGGGPCPAGSSLSAHLPAARPRRLASLSGVTVPPGYTTARARALDREAAASGRPIASGGNGHAYRVWFNEFFRGRLSDPAFQTSEANLIEFIKARGRALDREQVSNGSLTHPAAISIPGNKQSPAASVLTGKGPEKRRSIVRPTDRPL